jgi:UPF0755 protein
MYVDSLGDVRLEKVTDFLFFVCAAVVFCIICFLLPLKLPDTFKTFDSKTEIEIEPGMSAREAAVIMKKSGLISNIRLMGFFMSKFGCDRQLQSGKYDLAPGSEYTVAKQLSGMKPKTLNITLIPGTSFEELAKQLFGNRDDSAEKLAETLSNDSLFPSEIREILPSNPRFRTLYLLPDTYYLTPNGNHVEQFIQMSSKLWYKRIGKKIANEEINKRHLYDCGVIASLVEGEAKLEKDRPILAGIFLKRLRKHMRIQSCATVIYSWKEKYGVKKRKLTYKDLLIDYPYNTYKYNGMPPGPINIPSAESWKSSLRPQSTDYLFFFASPEGSHIFSRTYEEHIQKQKKAGIQ